MTDSERTDRRRREIRRAVFRSVRGHGAAELDIDAAHARTDLIYRDGKWGRACSVCGERFWGRLGQRYCSPGCAGRARNRSRASTYRRGHSDREPHPDLAGETVTANGRRGAWKKVCPQCGEQFTSKRADAVYCRNPLCRQAARRRRQRGPR